MSTSNPTASTAMGRAERINSAATLTERRETARAHGYEVLVNLSLEDLSIDRDWTVPCTLCGQPALLSISVDQQTGLCPNCRSGRTPRRGVCCLGCNRDCGTTDDYSCLDCAQRHAPGLWDAAMTIRVGQRRWKEHINERTAIIDFIDGSIGQIRNLAPPLLTAMGYDQPTITEGLSNYLVPLEAKLD